MARMHSRKKGKAGSTRPSEGGNPSWVSYKKTEVELLVSKLSKEGKSSSEIGIILRDRYGIPNAKLLLEKSISTLMKEKKAYPELPEDLLFLLRNLVRLQKHLETNTKDETAKRGFTLCESKIRRLVKYYKKTGKLSSEWKYDPKKASMYAE